MIEASTGPRSGERGRAILQGADGWLRRASTGPRSGERGRPFVRAAQWVGLTSFNGAALWRARKGALARTMPSASGLLQRGRALESAEGLNNLAHNAWVLFASTGPRSGERGRVFQNEPRPSHLWLQRGRALESAEGQVKHGRAAARAGGFNGAALWRARKVEAAFFQLGAEDLLQRGRALESAEGE